jgi:hypothetical protein
MSLDDRGPDASRAGQFFEAAPMDDEALLHGIMWRTPQAKKAEDFSSAFAYLRAIVVTVVCSPL